MFILHLIHLSFLSARDHDKTVCTNMTGREKTSDWLFCPTKLLANVSLCDINYVDNGINKVGRGKEGLKSLCRIPLLVCKVTGTNEISNKKEFGTSLLESANRLGPASE